MIALALAAAILAAVLARGRRWVWTLGDHGQAVAPAFLLILWFAFLGLGQFSGSLTAAAWIAAFPLLGIAGYAVTQTRRVRRRHDQWTLVDAMALAFLALFLIAYCGNDSFCHESVVNAYLRGNIPPTAQNDPDRPLRYHGLVDAAAALVITATGIGPESALDVVSIVCVFACLSGLQGLSRVVFEGRWAPQAARLFYLLGFGPIYLNHLGPILARIAGRAVSPPGSAFLHGQTTQSFVEVLPRRPMGLNHLLFIFLLASTLPLWKSSVRSGKGPHPLYWLPCAFVLPLASEDLTGLWGLIVVWLWIKRAIRFPWLIAWILTTLVALPLSGVLTSMIAPTGVSSSPRLALSWPPSLPCWVDLESPGRLSPGAAWTLMRLGMPILSFGSAWIAVTEWGPLFLGGLLLAMRDARRRVIVMLFGVGLVLASVLTLRGWYKADLDRFLFYGTSAGFLVSASWVEWLENLKNRGRVAQRGFAVAAIFLVIVPTIAGPVGFASRYSLYWLVGKNSRSPTAFSEAELIRIRQALVAVGPRALIATDRQKAQTLILAGFVVDVPMAPGYSIGIVDLKNFDAYPPENSQRHASWSFSPADDPQIAGHPVVAEVDGYRLIRGDLRQDTPRAPRDSSPGP